MKQNKKELGMGWNDFLVFCLGIRGVIGIIVAIVTIFSSLAAFEPRGIAVGVLSVAVSFFAIATREKLKYLSYGALRFVIGFFIAQFVVGVIDVAIAYAISPSVGFDFGDLMRDLIFMVAMLVINIPYYKKREDMFVN